MSSNIHLFVLTLSIFLNNATAMEDKEDSVPHSVVEKDTEALLLRDVLLNGILATGTLGHHVDSDSLSPDLCIEEDDLLNPHHG
jgi:hypothetical protein